MPSSEEWRPAPGGGDVYEVSSLGRVRSRGRYVVDKRGFRLFFPGKYLKTTPDPTTGYPRASLFGKGHYVHRSVCEAFYGPPPKGKPQVSHGDGDRVNNRVENLRWASSKDNAQDTIRHGRNAKLNRVECPKGHPYTPENIYILGSGARLCKTCTRESSKKTRNKPGRALPPGDPRHGTSNGYNNWKCRCRLCKKANSEYYKDYKRRKGVL